MTTLLLAACSGAAEPELAPGVVPSAVHEFVAAVSENDARRLATVASYPLDDDVVDGERIPEECFEAEIEDLLARGVSAQSDVRVEQIGDSNVQVEGMSNLISYQVTVAFISVDDGEEGRQLVHQGGDWRVLLLPNPVCDGAIADGR